MAEALKKHTALVRKLKKLSPIKRAAMLYYGGLPRVRRSPTKVDAARDLLAELDPENKLTPSEMEKKLKPRGEKFSRRTLGRARKKNLGN
jgi:hypothetical protein